MSDPGPTPEQALQQADLRVLLMCVFQLSGDRKWLQEPFLPRRDTRLIADEAAGFSDGIAAQIRAAALDLLDTSAAVEAPDDELMVELMSICLGETVPPEYAPMMRGELGFAPRTVDWPQPDSAPQLAATATPQILIVGAGASGIAIGHQLNQLGVAHTIVERGSSVGGTWRDNRYPGAGVDTPNHAYSYSFAPPNRWSRFFAPQPEIEDYLQRTAANFGVTDNIEFETEVRRCTWNASEKHWEVELAGPAGLEVRHVNILISAIGPFGTPQVPGIDGIDNFSGESFHTQHWPQDLEIAGKRVAIVGTGASAMQIVPTIADDVAELTIYQRSPQWARPIPRYQDPMPPGAYWLFDNMPFYAQWFRFTMLWRYGDGLLPFLKKDPDWPHPERSLNRINERHRVEMVEYMEAELADRPELVEKCLPDYPPYGKRILLDNDWYATLCKPNVALVDTNVDHLDETGIVDGRGSHRPHDVVVFATGFRITEMAARLNITGLDGLDLRDAWADDNPTAYLGISVPGFPNLFCMQGPGTGLGHGGSAIFQSEAQTRYITSCLAAMQREGLATIEVRQEPHDEWVSKMDAEHEQMIWTHPGMRTYYRNPHGRVVSVMPWRLVDYWGMTRDVDLADYRTTPAPQC